MWLLTFIDRWKQKGFLQIFTIYLRYLIGGAFIMAAFGMGKLDGTSNLMGSMSAPIQDLAPIQQFFRVMTDSGLYWKFIGWSQILAGVLLMSQRLARIGALMFFVIILNIFVITVAYEFTGTPIVTGLMLLATIYLLVWDVRSFLPLLIEMPPHPLARLSIADHPYWQWLGAVMIVLVVSVSWLRINFLLQLALPVGVGLLTFVIFFVFVHRRGPR